jgi:hypothetical protein
VPRDTEYRLCTKFLNEFFNYSHKTIEIMATVNGSNQPQFNGKLGRVVYYLLNGVLIVRGIGERTSPPSVLELRGHMATKIVCGFIKALKPFINIGFELVAKKNKSLQHNEVYTYLRKNAIKGEYPSLEVDYAKVILTMGDMPLPPDPTVEIIEEGLKFTWAQVLEMFGAHWTDQVMLAAYFPELKKAIYLTAGARRNQGVEYLPLIGIQRGNHAEIYFSFIADDRTRIATSIYMGRVLW